MDTLKLPSIDRWINSTRVQKDAFDWGVTPKANPGISFTCSKDFAAVFQNLEDDDEFEEYQARSTSGTIEMTFKSVY
jgi:hypothetical protein